MEDKLKPVIYIVVGVIALYLIIRIMRTQKRRQRQVSKEDKKIAVSSLRVMEQFNPDYQLGKTFAPIGDNAADLYAEQLRKAVKGLGTNEEMIYSTFSKLKNKVNISEIAARYYLKFRRDLRADVLRDLNDKEKAILFVIIKQLPNTS